MKVRVKIFNADLKLKPEMNCTASLSFSENQKMIAVPSSSVIFDKSKYWVMVFKDKHNIETRRVEIYRQLGDLSYIKSGLTEGETVISKDGLLIYDAIND
jgi:cobalt-zinc-cadmium efflux system membrane fusion protein